MPVRRLHACYSGTVQGVGFRFTVERIATSLGLTGWVKNLRDGRVEVLSEGDEKLLNDFLRRIRSNMASYIRNVDANWQEPTGEFDSFDIRFF